MSFPRTRPHSRVARGARALAIVFAYADAGCAPLKPRLERILLDPPAANIVVGGRQDFTVVGQMSDGRRVPVSVTFTATGGTITPQGSYSAGDAVGAFRVVAAATESSVGDTAEIVVTPQTAHAYTTTFPLTENPISEGGRWINGGTVGRDWTNVSTTPGRAIGHQVGAPYTDATAVLTGDWGPDQYVTARAFTTNQKDECYQEVEMRLRTTVAPSRITGYEVGFKASHTDGAYLIIVRWNGRVGDFANLYTPQGKRFTLRDGDVISASVVGNLITAYRNGVPMGSARDNTFASGSPGIGFNLENKFTGCPGTNGDYGFSSFTAGDFRPKTAGATLPRD